MGAQFGSAPATTEVGTAAAAARSSAELTTISNFLITIRPFEIIRNRQLGALCRRSLYMVGSDKF